MPFHFLVLLRAMFSPCFADAGTNTRASNPSSRKKRAIFRFDFPKTLFAVIRQIHLVHDDDDLPNA